MGMTVEQITKYGRESKECMITEYELVLHVTRLLCVLLFGGLFKGHFGNIGKIGQPHPYATVRLIFMVR